MPSPTSPAHGAVRSAQAMPMSSWSPGEIPLPALEPGLCERAVRAIWRSLDEHDLVDEHVREHLAAILEPLTAFPLGNRPQRLINVLKQPNPLDPSHLYWLTRRLLTLVPELQAIANSFDGTACASHRDAPIDAIDAIDAYQSLD